MEFIRNMTLLALVLFVGMLLLFHLGYRLGLRRLRADHDSERTGMAAVDGAVFALLGLLIAFTFSSAASRFDARRQLIVDEANAIGTAWLRLDIVPEAQQPDMRTLFKQYVDSRLALYDSLSNADATAAEHARSQALQNQMWTHAVDATQLTNDSRAAMLLLPALNEMFDVSTKRIAALSTHMPGVIFALLFALSLGAALLAGYSVAGAKRVPWMHMTAFAGIMAVTVYVILDLEYPRFGLIRVDSADKILHDVRNGLQ